MKSLPIRREKLVIFILLFSIEGVFAQGKNRMSVTAGICRSDLYSKIFYNYDFFEGGYPTRQTSINSVDVNVIFEKRIGRHLFLPIGVGFNQKGFHEQGMISDGSAHYFPYDHSFLQSFKSFSAGLSYDIYSFKNYIINISQLLNPELIEYDNTRFVFATRTNVSFQCNVSAKIGFKLAPYFQTALEDYITTSRNGKTYSWKPYAYGMSIGLVW